MPSEILKKNKTLCVLKGIWISREKAGTGGLKASYKPSSYLYLI